MEEGTLNRTGSKPRIPPKTPVIFSKSKERREKELSHIRRASSGVPALKKKVCIPHPPYIYVCDVPVEKNPEKHKRGCICKKQRSVSHVAKKSHPC